MREGVRGRAERLPRNANQVSTAFGKHRLGSLAVDCLRDTVLVMEMQFFCLCAWLMDGGMDPVLPHSFRWLPRPRPLHPLSPLSSTDLSTTSHTFWAAILFFPPRAKRRSSCCCGGTATSTSSASTFLSLSLQKCGFDIE